jgi:hypothetical protein
MTTIHGSMPAFDSLKAWGWEPNLSAIWAIWKSQVRCA